MSILFIFGGDVYSPGYKRVR